MPTDPAERKRRPVASGVLDYFPDAILAIAEVSMAGNEQHNPGKPLHWDRSKSTDEADTLLRHFMERGSLDVDGKRHSAKMAWRALAILQKEIEAANRSAQQSAHTPDLGRPPQPGRPGEMIPVSKPGENPVPVPLTWYPIQSP
jgi:hypothetical protein